MNPRTISEHIQNMIDDDLMRQMDDSLVRLRILQIGANHNCTTQSFESTIPNFNCTDTSVEHAHSEEGQKEAFAMKAGQLILGVFSNSQVRPSLPANYQQHQMVQQAIFNTACNLMPYNSQGQLNSLINDLVILSLDYHIERFKSIRTLRQVMSLIDRLADLGFNNDNMEVDEDKPGFTAS